MGIKSGSSFCALGLLGFRPLSLLKMANSAGGRTTSLQKVRTHPLHLELLSSFLSKSGWLTKSRITEGFGKRLIRKLSAYLHQVSPTPPSHVLHHQLYMVPAKTCHCHIPSEPSRHLGCLGVGGGTEWALPGHKIQVPRAGTGRETQGFREAGGGTWDGGGGRCGHELRWAWMTEKERKQKQGWEERFQPG